MKCLLFIMLSLYLLSHSLQGQTKDSIVDVSRFTENTAYYLVARKNTTAYAYNDSLYLQYATNGGSTLTNLSLEPINNVLKKQNRI